MSAVALEEVIDEARARRRVRSMHRPMQRAFAGAYLDRGLRPKQPLKTNADIAAFLQACALHDLDGTPITESTPEGDRHVATMIAAETVAALHRTGGKSSLDWYTTSIRRAVNVAAIMHPELADDAEARRIGHGLQDAEDARCVFFVALAVCSQNNEVRETVRYASEQYRSFVETGRFVPKIYGQKGPSIAANLDRFNLLLEACDGDVSVLRRFLSTPYTMGEVRKAAAEFGMDVGARELVDEQVMGSIVFGPKIGGGFYQNLVGNGDVQALTMDLWFMRSWGRYTGTLVRGELLPGQRERLAEGVALGGDELRAELDALGAPTGQPMEMAEDEIASLCRALRVVWERRRAAMVDESGIDNAEASRIKAGLLWPGAAEAIQKSLSLPVDAPGSAGDRRWIRSVVSKALSMLRLRGYKMTAADLQATLWYPEKDLYAVLGARKNSLRNASYDEALATEARARGYDDEAIAAALDSDVDHRSGARGVPGPAGPGPDGPSEGLREVADCAGGEPEEGLTSGLGRQG